jgi:hypothetical protein
MSKLLESHSRTLRLDRYEDLLDQDLWYLLPSTCDVEYK